jgi:WD40 repeat protein
VKEAKAIPPPKPFTPQPPAVDTTPVVVEVPEPAPRPKPRPSRPIIPRPIVPDTIAYTRIYYNNPAAFSSIAGDGATILTADSNGHGQLYDLRGELKETYDQPGGLSAFDYSVAGLALLGSQKGALVLADKYNNRWSKDLQHEGPKVTTATFSPQFGSPRYLKRILVCKDNGKVGLLDLYGRELRTLESEDKVSTASFSANGNRILTGSSDGVVRIWTADGTEPPESLENKKDGPITSIALSAGEDRVIASSANGNVTVWDLPSKSPLVIIPNTDNNKKVNRVAFKKQTSTVYLGYSDGSIAQYSIRYDGRKYTPVKEPWKYSQHRGPIQSMYFRDSDNKLLSTSADGSARIWAERK